MESNRVNKLDEKIKAKERPQSRVAAVMGGEETNEITLVKAVEKRTHRTSIIIKPSTYNKAVEKAKSLNISFNEAINQLLETWIQ